MSNEAKQAGEFIKSKLYWLSEKANEAEARATLAKLRRGIGKAPGCLPELWDITLNGLPEGMFSNDDVPSYGEWAVHTAMTLYAMHQQGKDIKKQCMDKEGEYFGSVVRKLVKNDEDEQRVKRRFDAAATSSSIEEFSHHLRGLVQMLKSKDLPLDYSKLTEDLYWFQIPAMRDSIRLRWGQDYYRVRRNELSYE